MKRYLLRILPVIVLSIACNIGIAQEVGEKRLAQIEKTVEKMGQIMELDEKKKSEILELKKIAELNFQEISKTLTKGTDEFKNARKRVSRSYQLALKKICSKDQMDAWHQYQKDKKEQRKT